MKAHPQFALVQLPPSHSPTSLYRGRNTLHSVQYRQYLQSFTARILPVFYPNPNGTLEVQIGTPHVRVDLLYIVGDSAFGLVAIGVPDSRWNHFEPS